MNRTKGFDITTIVNALEAATATLRTLRTLGANGDNPLVRQAAEKVKGAAMSLDGAVWPSPGDANVFVEQFGDLFVEKIAKELV